MGLWRTISYALLGTVGFCVSGLADDALPRGFDSTWIRAIEQMVRPQIDSPAIRLTNFTFEQADFSLALDSGTFFPFVKLPTRSDSIVYGGFLSGTMTFDFRPPVRLEQDQLQRFFKADTLVFRTGEAVLFFDKTTWSALLAAGKTANEQPSAKQKKLVEKFQKPLTRKEDYWFLFTAIRAAIHPRPEPYLLVNCEFSERNQVVYLTDPYHREQVHLFREHNVPGEEYMELSLAVCDLDRLNLCRNQRRLDRSAGAVAL